MVKKKWFGVALAICFIALLQIPVYGKTEEKEFIYETIGTTGDIRILRYNGTKSELTIPEKIDGKCVVEIGENAFYGNNTLEQVSIQGKGIKKIGENAFAQCKKLKVLNAHYSSIQIVESNAFYQCENLQHAYFSNSLKELQERVFWECTKLSDVLLGSGIKKIGQMSFYGCSSLKSILLPNGFEYLGTKDGNGIFGGVFYGCSGLEEVYIGKGMKQLPANTFYGCTSLKKVILPDTITEIRSKAFAYCRNLKEVNIPMQLTKLGTGAFYHCKSLESVVFPDSFLTLESQNGEEMQTFGNCSSLKTLVLGNQIEEIGEYAFSDCVALEEVVLPKTIHHINGGVFFNCKKLKDIYCLGNIPTVEGSTLENCAKNICFYYTIGASNLGNYYPVKLYDLDDIFYTITLLDRDDGTVIEKVLARKGSFMSAPVIPEKEGYYFQNWFNEENGENWKFHKESVTHDMTLKATWKVKSYIITFDPSDGTLLQKQKAVNYKSQVGALPVPVKKDYKFLGWYTKENGEGKRYKETSKMPAHNMTLYAKWRLYPEKPKSVVLKGEIFSPDEIKLTWKKVEGVSGYDVYRSTSKNGTYHKIASTSDRALGYVNTNLKKGTTYYYRVRSFRILEEQKFYSDYSNKVKVVLTGKPAKPELVAKKSDETTADLSWTKVKDADGYLIYYKTNPKEKLKQFASFEPSILGCYHMKLTKGKGYYYAVRAYTIVKGKRVYGDFSNIQKVSF